MDKSIHSLFFKLFKALKQEQITNEVTLVSGEVAESLINQEFLTILCISVFLVLVLLILWKY